MWIMVYNITSGNSNVVICRVEVAPSGERVRTVRRQCSAIVCDIRPQLMQLMLPTDSNAEVTVWPQFQTFAMCASYVVRL